MAINTIQINQFVIDIFGITMFNLGQYNDKVIDDRYICIWTKNIDGYLVYINDTYSDRIIEIITESDPYIYIEHNKLMMKDRLFKYYDLFNKCLIRKMPKPKKNK